MTPKKASSKEAPKGRRGKAINLYLHPGDDEVIHKLRLYLMQQGHVASQSQVIRAALRLAKPNPALVESCLEMIETDGRRKA
jgi:hypothetical protein